MRRTLVILSEREIECVTSYTCRFLFSRGEIEIATFKELLSRSTAVKGSLASVAEKTSSLNNVWLSAMKRLHHRYHLRMTSGGVVTDARPTLETNKR